MEQQPDLAIRYRLFLDLARQVPGAEPAAIETYLQFGRVARARVASQETFLARFGLSEGKLVVLQLLHQAPRERRTPSALAGAAGVTRGTMTGLLAGLERAGLVTRAVHPDDARMFTIELTAPARDLLERVLPERVARIMAFMAALTPDEQCQLRGLLAKLEGAMSALSSP